MNTKHQILEKKVLIFIQKLDEHKPGSEYIKNYIATFRKSANIVLDEIRNNTLEISDGFSFGWSRGISECDELGFDYNLYDAAHDADIYYRDECATWEDTPKKTESEESGFSVV